MGKPYHAAKRCFDIGFAAAGLLLSLPLLLGIAAWIKLDSPGPVLFVQIRVGRWNVPFPIYKFRTMAADAERMGRQITVGKDPRITRSGAFLRKYKIDELPQLLNILLGHMSFVGPRPEVPYYVNFYNEEQKAVLAVRPGITDFASIKYRNENELLAAAERPDEVYIREIMPDKLSINLEYIHNPSFVKDVSIILKTLVRIVS